MSPSTADGISVNITLIFSIRVYEQVIDAYMSGLEERVAKGLPISQIHSVASFFVSRVDTAVDKLLDTANQNADPATRRANMEKLRTQIDGILTPDQRAQWQQMKAERAAKRQAEGKQ